jgi:hypothetical protein
MGVDLGICAAEDRGTPRWGLDYEFRASGTRKGIGASRFPHQDALRIRSAANSTASMIA